MKVDVLLGLQWGDEGKGKFVDALARDYDAVARFHGGSNAGHTLIVGDSKIVLNSIPSGILHKGIINIIGSGVVLDVMSFTREVNMLHEAGYDLVGEGNLWISEKAHLLLPTHALLDRQAEQALGEAKIGSTQKGIAPAYADKVLRKGLRVMDILTDDFPDRVYKMFAVHALWLKQEYELATDIEMLYTDFMKQIEGLQRFKFVDTAHEINSMVLAGKRILAEGAQATLLDIDHGTYPYVTSSNTTVGAVCTGLGVAPKHMGEVFGVVKAYSTRVGNGPFLTEQHDDVAEAIRIKGKEFGAVTKRPRRIGWLDLPALRYAIMINGVDKLIITKADVLSGLDYIDVCTGYVSEDGTPQEYAAVQSALQSVRPRYRRFAVWKEDISELSAYDDLPEALRTYIEFLERMLRVPIAYVSTGPERKQTLKR